MKVMNAVNSAVRSSLAAGVIFTIFLVSLLGSISQEIDVGTIAVITLFIVAVASISFTLELIIEIAKEVKK